MAEHQPNLFDFLDGAVKPPPTKEEQRKKAKRLLIVEAKRHLKEFLQLLLESSDRSSIRWEMVSAIVNKTLKEMEEEGICYFKKMPDGKTRIFKKVYCCFGVKEWKKCPEYYCPFWPENGSECPYNPNKNNLAAENALDNTETIEIVHKDKKDEDQSET